MSTIVAFSGGKDSTAMALRMAEAGETFRLLYTPTGNELPGVREHIDRVVRETEVELVDLDAPTLEALIEEQQCLPNFRMRWCTRMIKIEPVAAWLRERLGAVLCVGLRADEQGRAGGTYDAEVRYPLREWGWDEQKVLSYCAARGFSPPKRTDCALCFYQTLGEWHDLWREHPTLYAQGEVWEAAVGHTLRSPRRDTWPAALADLRAEFEKGRVPRRRQRRTMCRVCSL